MLVPSLGLSLLVSLFPQPVQAERSQPLNAVMTPYAAAEPLFQLLRSDLLPELLRPLSTSERAAAWRRWVEARAAALQARIHRGNEDTVVNLLAYGTSFTAQPRFTYADVPQLLESAALRSTLSRRIEDLAAGLIAGRATARLRFARDVIDPSAALGEGALRDRLLALVTRVVDERRSLDRADADARNLADPYAMLIERGTLFRERGIASDTSIFPNHAIDIALQEVAAAGWLRPGDVTRVAIIGPGLDMVDKQDGHDFQPVQTLQPFAIQDSLLRLGLARPAGLALTACDVNPAVVGHLHRVRDDAGSGPAYTLWLPRDSREVWLPALATYWAAAGSLVGRPIEPPPGTVLPDGMTVRVIEVAASAVQRVQPCRLDIVLERLVLRPEERFDVIVATNTLVYYGLFEQALALANAAAMLRPGGLLLANNVIPSSEEMAVVGFSDVPFTEKGDGERIMWYRRQR